MILAVIQARCSSRRLPGKVLLPILGRPMLAHQVERVRRAQTVDRLLVATSTESSDDAIEALGREIDVEVFRGSLDDVLDRFYHAARPLAPEHVVRLTGDCPLLDPDTIDRVARFHLEGNYDYTSNMLARTIADGFDVEVIRHACLEQAWSEARLPSQREHVTSYFYQSPDLFRVGSFVEPVDRGHERWVVDEPEDFELVSRVFEALYTQNPEFDYEDVARYLAAHPEVAGLNKSVDGKAGWKRSMEEDERFRSEQASGSPDGCEAPEDAARPDDDTDAESKDED